MRILFHLHNNHLYELRLVGEEFLEVYKDSEEVYFVDLATNKCTCPGFTHHRHCWHTREIPALLPKFIPVCEPWCEWVEEAQGMKGAFNDKEMDGYM